MKRPLPIPDAATAFTSKEGQATTHGRRYLDSLNAAVIDTQTGKASISQTYEQSWLIEFPDDKDYKVVVNSALARTITGVTTITTAGTATVTIKINSTALGGTANSASTSEQSQSHSSDNSVAVGDDIVITVSSTSGAENLSVTLTGTLTLAA